MKQLVPFTATLVPKLLAAASAVVVSSKEEDVGKVEIFASVKRFSSFCPELKGLSWFNTSDAVCIEYFDPSAYSRPWR